jgi:hypothetical protein
MISLYINIIENVWFGTAWNEGQNFATAFVFSQTTALQSLLKDIPFNIPFQHSEKSQNSLNA